MRAVGLRLTASVWLVTATFSLGVLPASAGEPMGLAEAARRLSSGVPGPTELEQPPQPATTAAAELVTLRDALANDKDMTPEEKARVMRRVAQLMAQTADDEARRRRQQIISEDPVADTAAMVDSTLNYYAVLSGFHEYEQNLASAYRDDPATVHWLALANECRRVISGLKLNNLDYAAPILLRLRMLEGQCHLKGSQIYFRTGNKARHLLHYRRGVNLLELVLNVDPDRFPPPPAIPDRLNNAITNAGLVHTDVGGNSQPVSMLVKTQHVLAEFCPWGVGIYEMLADAGLTQALDWRILRPYADEEVVQVGPIVLLADELIPASVRAYADDIARGVVPYGEPPTFQWRRKPKLSCSVCFLSRAAFGWQTSDTVGLMWKAFVFLTAGPGAVIEEAVQDYLVSEIGRVHGPENPIYATVAPIHDVDNWGFDKSMIWTGKLDVKKPKLLKSFLVYVLQMNEGTALARLFSGRVPPLADLQRSTLDARSYDNGPIAHVILRADVHGLEDVGKDEHVRIWDFTRFHILSPNYVSGVETTYNLHDAVVRDLTRERGYVAGDVEVQKRVWVDMGSTKEFWGFQRRLIDFAPLVQVVRVNVPDDVLDEWRKMCNVGETVAALLRYSTGAREVVPGSVQQIGAADVTWRLEDKRRQKIIEERKSPSKPGAEPSLTLYAEWHADKVVQIDVPRKSYTFEVVRCRIGSPEPRWESPLSRLISVPVTITDYEKGSSGKVTEFAAGCEQIAQEIEWEAKTEGPAAFPFKHCHVSFTLRLRTEDDQGSQTRAQDISYVAEGKFSGNTFTGTFRDTAGSREDYKSITEGTVTVKLRPGSREVGGVKLSERIESARIVIHQERMTKHKDGTFYGATRDWDIVVMGLPLVEESGLLQMGGVPLTLLWENERARQRYNWAMLGYTGHQDDGKSSATITYKCHRVWDSGQRTERQVAVVGWRGGITFGF